MSQFLLSFIIVTDIGCDADDILATIQVLNTLRHLRRPARIAFVLTMLNPHEKAIFLKHLLSLFDFKGFESQLEFSFYLAEGYNTLEDANKVHPNFPPRFGAAYDQLQGINKDTIDQSDIKEMKDLHQFTDSCADHSIHLLVLSPISMTEYIDFDKINPSTVHMMGGTAVRAGVEKIGYNIGVSPPGFVALCKKTNDQAVVVTTATCDATRIAVNFAKVKELLRLDDIGNFMFTRMMEWHLYITKKQTNFLEVSTPCISDLVAADVFLRAVFPSDYQTALNELVRNAVEDRSPDNAVPAINVTITTKPAQMKINLEYKGSYLDDTKGELFKAENGTEVNFREATINYDVTSEEDYATYLVTSVFTH